MTSNLQQLEADVQRSLNLLGGDIPNWVAARPGADLDVLIVGAGQSGTALTHALKRSGTGRIAVIDAAGPADIGVWRTKARMLTLRTLKQITGPELGVPALTFRAWFEASHGTSAYEALDKIPREIWDDYLIWYRQILGIKVRYHTRLTRIDAWEHGLTVTLEEDGKPLKLNVRKLVLATGVDGLGAPYVPEIVLANLPAHVYAHTHDPIDFNRLKGSRVAVLGAASSAFDAAATALENGAASVDLYCRKPALANWAGKRLAEYPGVADYFHLLPDEDRWRLIRGYRARGTAPQDTIRRATRFENFHLHLGQPWRKVFASDGHIRIETPDRRDDADFAIIGTGYVIDLSSRQETRNIAPLAASWGDRFTPHKDERDDALALYPYLDGGLAFQERVPGSAPWVRHIHAFSYGGVLSHGAHVGEIQSLRSCIPTVADALGRALFTQDKAEILERIYEPLIANSHSVAAE